MTIGKILDTTAFDALDENEQKVVENLYTSYTNGESLNNEERSLIDTKVIFDSRGSLLVPLDYHIRRLNEINPVAFDYMTDIQKQAHRRELLLTFYKLSAQYQLSDVLNQKTNLRQRSEQIKKCADLIHMIDTSTKERGRAQSDEEKFENAVHRVVTASEKHAKYLGLTTVAPLLADVMVSLDKVTEWGGSSVIDWLKKNNLDRVIQWDERLTGLLKKNISEVNGKRLQWVWGNALLGTVFSLLGQQFDWETIPVMQGNLNDVSKVTGYISWIIYYIRGGIELTLFLKNATATKPNEYGITSADLWKAQWAQRKFALLNDWIWGAANMACHLVLTGSGMLGYVGNVVTVGLLIMDLSLTAWRYHEEETQHYANVARYDRDIAVLCGKLSQLSQLEVAIPENDRLPVDLHSRLTAMYNAALEASQEDLPLYNKRIKDLKEAGIIAEQLNALLKAKRQCQFDWKYKKSSTVNDLLYAAGLLCAFLLMTCVLFPPATMVALGIVGTTAIAISCAGAGLCFLLNTIYAAMSVGTSLNKERASIAFVKDEFDMLLAQYNLPTTDEMTKKQLFLDMKLLKIECEYHKEMIYFQKIKLAHTILVEALFPPAVFLLCMFFPLGLWAIAVVAAAFALTMASKLILNLYEPSKGSIPAFDEEEFNRFERLEDKTFEAIDSQAEPVKQPPFKFFSQGVKAQDLSQGELEQLELIHPAA